MPAPVPQVKCEVCETVQPPASECANCGVKLQLPPGVRPIADAPIEPVEGFEATSSADVGVVANDSVPDLEETIQRPTPDVRVEFVPGFEATEELQILDLPGEDDTVPDLEHTVEDFEKTPTAPATDNRCQYCGFVQASGRICNNCGLARSKVLPGAPRTDTESIRVRCPACGAIVFLREHCSDCGQPLPQEKS